jgi:hypothetical protein
MASQEQKKNYAVLKRFRGINTKAQRTAINEDEFAWLENAMPIGDSNIKIVPAQSAVSNSTNSSVVFGNVVTYLTSSNIDQTDYVVGFEDSGRSEAFNLSSNVLSNVAVSGTFSGSNVSATQWKNERLIIGDPSKGLFSWNSNNVVFIGSVGLIAITNPGSGYLTAPTVTIGTPNDSNGVQATAVCTIVSGSGGVRAVQVTAGGSGYTSVPTVTLGSPNLSGGVQATAIAAIQGGAVVAVSVVEAGSGYTSAPSVSFSGGGGSSAAATAIPSTGGVNSVTLTNAGTGYTSPPTVTFTGGGGTNAAAIAQILTFKKGTVSVLVTNGGSGYTSTPTVTIAGAGTSANAVAVVLGNSVSSIVMDNPGINYLANTTVTISAPSVPSGNTTATATAVVNTDEIVSVATFSGRTWVAAGRTVYYSAADSYSDFTGTSAGAFVITDSTLHGNIRALLSANNFLYIFGDDSINVFSDVRVDTNGQTLFTNTNVSASVGTKRIYAIFPFFRSVLFMNDYGIYSLVGSTTSKLSDDLDGVFPNIDFSLPVSGGQVLLNNILCAAFNFTYNDPEVGPRQVQAVFFEKKWFMTSQGELDYITSVPSAGLIRLYGVDGRNLYRLYANSTAQVASKIKTALMPMGDAIRTKQALKFGIEATLSDYTTLTVSVDNETSTGTAQSYTLTTFITWLNNFLSAVTWTNNSNNVVNWTPSNSYALYKSDAQQYGKYLGLTITSSNAAFIVSTFEFEHELRVRF